MANRTEYVREQANVRPTPEDRGVETVIKVVAYDNGMIKINDNVTSGPNGRINATRFVVQMLEELFDQLDARKKSNVA
jgi:hypothetical protein